MNINIIIFIIAIIIAFLGFIINRFIVNHINTMSHLITSLTPIVGEEIKVDVSTTKGIDQALHIVEEAIKVTQEAVKKSEEAAKAKSLFLANMSHEIRTPLNGILGFLELLETTELTEEQQDYVNTISQSAKNLLQIVNNILDVSKIESNKVTLEIIDFKALDEFESTIELFATPTAQKGIELVTEISPDIPTVIKGDILKIKEVLTNLLSNAVKFTHKDGSIKVKIQNRGIENNQVKLYFEVTDTGIGMTEEQKKKVFEAFAQADESVTRKYGGTGLGLTIVKSYIEMMGGEIEVESELNRGTTFKFEIPFEVVDATPKYAKNLFNNKTVAVLHTDKRSLRVDTTFDYFNFFGINKIGFNTAEEIESIKEKEKIDGIVIFYDESNRDIIEELTNTDTPLVFVTSYARKEEISKYGYTSAIFDPNLPSKIVNAIDALKEEKKTTKKTAKKEAQKEIYNLKVLIAEDNPINQKLLQTTLKTLGVESDVAQNGLEAFNKYTMNPDKYDAIFTDVQMPVMDGVEATYEILEFEKEEEIPHTPIIAVTANVLKGDRERFLGAGMDDYISKPINKDELLKVLEKVANGEYVKDYNSDEEEVVEETPQTETENEEVLPVVEEEITETTQNETTKEIEETVQKEETEATEEAEKIEEVKEVETTEETQEPETTEEAKETAEIKVPENNTCHILASNSKFLIKYIETALEDMPMRVVGNLKDLLMIFHSVVDKDVIILIEEEFDGEDTDNIISILKKASDKVKVYTILAQKEHPSADGNISDLNPENIRNSIKG
jgi:signal transduction histidine kinase/CheY-like chemotaxis protein